MKAEGETQFALIRIPRRTTRSGIPGALFSPLSCIIGSLDSQ